MMPAVTYYVRRDPCPHCGGHHGPPCPVKAIEYFPDGNIKRIEFFTPVERAAAPLSGSTGR
jgi:hypothetical protein